MKKYDVCSPYDLCEFDSQMCERFQRDQVRKKGEILEIHVKKRWDLGK